MSKTYNKAIYMSLKQLLIVFYQRKIKGILMPSAMSEIDADDRQLKEAMAGMIGQGLIVLNNKQQLTLSEEARAVADIIAGAEHIYRIGNKQLPQQFIYRMGQEAVLMNLDVANPEMVRLEHMDLETAFDSIAEYPGMPEDDHSSEPSEACSFATDAAIEELVALPEVVTVIDRYQRGNERFDKRLIVSDKAGKGVISCIRKDEEKSQSYSRQLLVSAAEED